MAPTYKRCTSCRLDLPLDKFYVRRSRGKTTRNSRCKDCTREDFRARYHSDSRTRNRKLQQVAAHQAAERQLRINHRDEFDRLYNEELRARGLR